MNEEHSILSASEESGAEAKSDEVKESATREVQKEAKVVCFSKALIYFILALAALAVSTTTFMLTFNGEEDEFESDFAAHANEILLAAKENIRAKDSMIQALSVSFTSSVMSQNQTWPFVSMPDFEKQTLIARQNSGASMIGFCPVVYESDKAAWNDFSVNNQQWVYEGLAIQGRQPATDTGISPDIFDLTGVDNDEYEFPGWYLPVWQQGPAPDNPAIINGDTMTYKSVYEMGLKALKDRRTRLSDIIVLSDFLKASYTWYEEEYMEVFEDGLARDLHEYKKYLGVILDEEDFSGRDFTAFDVFPYSFILQPVFKTLEEEAEVGGMFFVLFPWLEYFRRVLREVAGEYLVYLDDHCGHGMTITLDGPTARLLGYEDMHDSEYDYLGISSNLASLAGVSAGAMESTNECYVTMTVYPTQDLHHFYKTKDPYIYALVCLLIFIGTALVFALYDYYVELRERKVERAAARTQALVSSLFPKNVQERILEEANNGIQKEDKDPARKRLFGGHKKDRMMEFLDEDDQDTLEETLMKTRPIADLFPATTILFCDIVGFTAWSSSRGPEQVFILLETLYHHFDIIAKKRGVYKVETIGDCYVAVCGLPQPRKDHAIVMCKFARDCLAKMHLLIKELEAELGPDTSRLGMRFGLHSGSVTAGVLRGERARFQLFGDTMNTASRMESNGVPNRIQVSEQTAEELHASGKSSWLVPREDKIFAKGKGELQTYFVEIPTTSHKDSSTKSTSSESLEDRVGRNLRFCPVTGCLLPPDLENKSDFIPDHELERLVGFSASILQKPLATIAASRHGQDKWQSEQVRFAEEQTTAKSAPIVEEAQGPIPFPKDDVDYRLGETPEDALSSEVVEQLQLFVQAVATCYKQRPLHNFRHCSGSLMSVAKILGNLEGDDASSIDLSVDVANVVRNPLVSFALLFACLIGNVDHPGVTNEQYMIEQPTMTIMYKRKCLIRQNAFDIVWAIFMDDTYTELRHAIYATREEFKCFRQTVIKSVLAMDSALESESITQLEETWKLAFASGPVAANRDERNSQATVVLESIMAGTEVFYCFQHWDIFYRWSERGLEEAMEAFASNRIGGSNPLEYWHEHQAELFDKFSVPVMKRLSSAGVLTMPCVRQLVEFVETNRTKWREKVAWEEMKQVFRPPELPQDSAD